MNNAWNFTRLESHPEGVEILEESVRCQESLTEGQKCLLKRGHTENHLALARREFNLEEIR